MAIAPCVPDRSGEQLLMSRRPVEIPCRQWPRSERISSRSATATRSARVGGSRIWPAVAMLGIAVLAIDMFERRI
jgi:hypothetical protein